MVTTDLGVTVLVEPVVVLHSDVYIVASVEEIPNYQVQDELHITVEDISL